MLAIALERYRFRGRGTLDGIAYLPIIIPDVTMAVMLLIFFFQAFGMLDDLFGINLSAGLLTITLAHIAFCISFVADGGPRPSLPAGQLPRRGGGRPLRQPLAGVSQGDPALDRPRGGRGALLLP